MIKSLALRIPCISDQYNICPTPSPPTLFEKIDSFIGGPIFVVEGYKNVSLFFQIGETLLLINLLIFVAGALFIIVSAVFYLINKTDILGKKFFKRGKLLLITALILFLLIFLSRYIVFFGSIPE